MTDVLHIGFTGTRFGMTEAQHTQVEWLVAGFSKRHIDRILATTPEVEGMRQLVHGHHGDCDGSDEQFHHICRRYGLWMVGHPPVDDGHRAFCTFDEMRDPLTHMKRNKAIVTDVRMMIATPRESTELQYGGTWKTCGMTRRADKPLYLVWPDGRIQAERELLL